MKRAFLFVAGGALLAGLAGCATGGAGGAGGGGMYTDCSIDYCVDYDGLNARRIYLRTPGGPAPAPRGAVTTADARGGTQVVTRDAVTPAPASARMSPIPTSGSRSGGSRP
jgi:hypothetical protein